MPTPRRGSYTTATSSMLVNCDDWEIVPSADCVSTAMDMFPKSTSTTSLDALSQYTTRPLPSLPIPIPSPSNAFNNQGTSRSRPRNLLDRLGPECGRDEDKQKATDDTSPLEAFLDDQQSHERLAMGLDRVPRLFYARANAGFGARTQRPAVSRKHRTDPKKDSHKGDKDNQKM